LLTYYEALEKIIGHSQTLPKVERKLEEMLGYVLAEPVVAKFPMPQFDNSAVDGFGVLLRDVENASENSPVSLSLLGEVQAGAARTHTIASGQAVKILTGATVPSSVEAVVMREYCEENKGRIVVKIHAEPGENIRRKGGEYPAGTEVLSAGMSVTPPVVGLLASLGFRSFAVYDKPRVAIIATGDELVPPGEPLQPGQIYNSNSFALRAALQAFGIEPTDVLHALDSAESTRAAFEKAIKNADVVISTGGVSVGDYDYVKDVLESLGVQTVFWRIAVKPGKPVYFGIVHASASSNQKLVFGLPGNPVSGLVTYHQFVLPALRKLSGCPAVEPKPATAVLGSKLRKKPGRLDFIRGQVRYLDDGSLTVEPTVGQDSHMISGLAKADSLIHFAADAESIEAGSKVLVDLLQWWS